MTTPTTTAQPKILQSYVHASGLRFDEFRTRFGGTEYFLVDIDGETLFQGSLGNCITEAARRLGLDAEWVHGQACGPDWRAAETLQKAVTHSTWGAHS